MEIILAISITGALTIVSFYVGARIGQKISHDEPIALPSLPVKEDKNTKKSKDKLATILNNIDNYDGTSKGQVEVK